MISRTIRQLNRFFALSGVLILATACGEVAGVDEGVGEVQITLQEATTDALFQIVAADLSSAPEATAGRVPRELVRSLNVTVTDIQLLPFCEDAGEQNGDGQCEDLWVSLGLGDAPFDLDLLDLPTEEETAITLAAGTIPAGEYHKIRLYVSEATVTFFEEISVGHSNFAAYDASDSYDPNDPNTETVHTVEISSAGNTGIKADIELVVDEVDPDAAAQDVALLFDADATFRNVIATGNGRVRMPPVLKARGLFQHENQNGG